MSDRTPSDPHNPDEDGWCQKPGCDWNVWNAKSTPSCPVGFGGKNAGTVQEQEDMLMAKVGQPVPTEGVEPVSEVDPHTQEEADAGLRELIKMKMREYPDAGTYVEDKNLDEIMAAVQAHTARIREEAVQRITHHRDNCAPNVLIANYCKENDVPYLVQAGVYRFALDKAIEQLSPIQPNKQDKP